MSKVLVIQPSRMLRHALVCALFPDHEVHALESIPDCGFVEQFDAVIIDTDALEETFASGAEPLRVIESWKIATVCIDGKMSSTTAPRGRLRLLSLPVTQETLRDALAQSLVDGNNGVGARGLREAGNSPVTDSGKANAAFDAGRQQTEVIELVDVVEEESSQG